MVVKYYLENNIDICETYELFKFRYILIYRNVKRYENMKILYLNKIKRSYIKLRN